LLLNSPLRILIVEDSEEDELLLVSALQAGGFEVVHTRVQTADGMRAALLEQTWDVVVSDYTMPAFSGIEALAVLKATGIDVPLIISSGTITEDMAVEALKAGAADFVLKGRLARLVPAIDREIRQAVGRRQRVLVEGVLSETTERMQFALESAGVGTWEAELASGKATWSPILEKLHGLPVGGFGGTIEAFIACIHPEDRQQVLERISQSQRDRTSVQLEYRTIWPDGLIHWVAGMGRTLYDEMGMPIRAAGASFDITARKNLEEQVRQSQKMEAIGSLAAGIAHDFNNLLMIMSGYCELLADRLQGDMENTAELTEIQRAASSATTLTRQLLAFSRRQILAPQALNLNSILIDSQKMMRRLVEENVQINLRLAEHLSPINIDAGQVEQVLLNLVVNARDAMPNGGVVTMETSNVVIDEAYAGGHVDVQPGPHVLLSVRDTGHGIPADVKARLFEPFFTTKERGRGTGLGLATVYGIVKQSGGHIVVDSEAGVGTAFTIYFPAAVGAVVSIAAAAKKAPATLAGDETILIVEDDESLRALAERSLRRYGYRLLLAKSGDDAQKILAAHDGPVHVVVTDVVMPNGGGRALGDWIARHHPETKVIYMSGYADAIVQHGILDPGTIFLQKPFSPESLASKIREAQTVV
jgi:two-component system cell cycle sensor histidine kinase/response regulator CckA